MLTTNDLYTRPGYGIDVGDIVRFELLRGLELRTSEEFKSRFVERLSNSSTKSNVVGLITDYRPWKLGDLEIEGLMGDGYSFRLRLNQCRALCILEGGCGVGF